MENGRAEQQITVLGGMNETLKQQHAQGLKNRTCFSHDRTKVDKVRSE
jgi:hypothetical protein